MRLGLEMMFNCSLKHREGFILERMKKVVAAEKSDGEQSLQEHEKEGSNASGNVKLVLRSVFCHGFFCFFRGENGSDVQCPRDRR